jgi:hypothetical protein
MKHLNNIIRRFKGSLIFRLALLTISGLLFIGLSLFYEHMMAKHYLTFAAEQIHPRLYLQEQAKQRDLPFALLDRIVWCESHWQMKANSRSTAYGYFQILDNTETTTPQYRAGLRKFDAFTNIEMGLYLFEKHGAQPWHESRSCWQG